MRSLQTDEPLGVCRSSGSRVRLPTRTTRLMFAMVLLLLRGDAYGFGDILTARLGRRHWPGVPCLRAPNGHVAHDSVGDAQNARDLRERLRLGRKREQVIGAVGLVVDLVGELAPSPDVVCVPGAAALLDQLTRARDDLGPALLRELGVEHEQDLVVDHGAEWLLPSV